MKKFLLTILLLALVAGLNAKAEGTIIPFGCQMSEHCYGKQ